MRFGGRIIGTLVQMDDDLEDVSAVQTDHERDTDDLVVEMGPLDGYDPKHSKQWNALVAQQSLALEKQMEMEDKQEKEREI
jgi:hypothetical protein